MWPKGTGDLIVQWLFRRHGRTPANWNQALGVCLIIVWPWMQIQRSYCAPFSTYRNGTPMAPCGAIANSMFNGTWAPPSAPCSGSLLTLFPYPRPGETWCCKVCSSSHQKGLFGGAALVNMRLLFFSDLALVWKLREISHFLRPSSMWAYSSSEEFRPSWNKEPGCNILYVLPC